MPIQYKILEDRKLVYALGEGTVTFTDLKQHLDELSKDTKYVPPMKKLVDYRTSNIASLTKDEAQRITDMKAQLSGVFHNEVCAFVTQADLDFGMSRVHGAHIAHSNIKTNVFRDINDALAWLNVELDESEVNLG